MAYRTLHGPPSEGRERLNACLDHRLQPASSCQDRCLARNACPVGEPYRYGDEQIAYHYLQSMRAIREYRQASDRHHPSAAVPVD